MQTKRKIHAEPSIKRLPSYLATVRQIHAEGGAFVSGTLIAETAGLDSIQVRKDLAMTGIVGKPKKGYPVKELIAAIERFLGWNTAREAALIGAGNLGSALIGHQDFRMHGLYIRAAFDNNPAVIGRQIHGVPVFAADTARDKILAMGIKTAILTVPPQEAQKAVAVLTEAGIEAIWNFTNITLKVHDRIAVRNEDLSSGYALLCVMAGSGENRRTV
ncbi:MAG: redox-sensing transcriptional repressor Rex [Spirochaetaceae bacterium]|jgi:redox-sensing transcriptional repressor|nr:redox-sensing transcriptional repressor Rex [Spirochaetaceae bacterium]